MKKELRPFHDNVACDVCERTILKGERTEAYLAPGGHRHLVCKLCQARAEHAGWIRESAADQYPTRSQRTQERRGVFARFRRPRGDERDGVLGADELAEGEAVLVADLASEAFAGEPDRADQPEPTPRPQRPRRREQPQDPRHVRAVPTTAEAKVERALELFNASEHQRVVAGVARTLGYPWATAVPDADSPSSVTVVVAWELSWYRYRIDLGDAAEPVALQEKGEELENIDEALRQWNAGLDADGKLGVEGEQ